MPNRAIIDLIQQRDFLISTPEKSVRAIAVHMKQESAAAVLVVDEGDGQLIGICTERDLAFKVLADGLDAGSTPVGAVMTANPQSIGPDKPFGHALHLMYEGGFRHLPVVDPGGRPIGLISSRDALGLEIVDFRQEIEQREKLTEIL
jgi:CBS domain-containing protein